MLAIGAFTLTVSLLQLNSLVNLLGLNPVDLSLAKTPKVASVVKHQTTQSSSITIEPFLPERIEIERIGMDLKVVPVPMKNGTWEVNDGVANFAEGTSLVNPKGGNVGLYGHDLMDSFHKIKDLRSGDIVVLSNSKFRAVYSVESVSVVQPTKVDIFAPTEKSQLTLMTCSGWFSSQRYVVKASLKELNEN